MTGMEANGSQFVVRIVSGGQTGVDRAALDAAIACGIEHGGWCPRGRIAEDGRISDRYNLQQTDSAEYPVRTERNVVDSDGTLILFRGRVYGGTELTRRLAIKHGKPCQLVDLLQPYDFAVVRAWFQREGVLALNVAGPRESSSPGIQETASAYLRGLFASASAK